MYNKRNMEFLENEIERGKHDYLKDVLKDLKQVEEKEDLSKLYDLQMDLNAALRKLEKNDEKGWRRDLLLNYFLNLELTLYKKKSRKYTKWSIFLEKIKEHNDTPLIRMTEELDKYISSQEGSNNKNKEDISQEKMHEIESKYENQIKSYIKQHMDLIDGFRAELRLSQRVNLLKRKVTTGANVSFGDWVKTKRTAKGWSLSKLGEAAGYSAAYIFRIEKGTRKNPTPQVVSKIVEALGYKPEDYMNLLIDDSNSDLKPMELSDLILMSDYTVNGRKVSHEERQQFATIIDLIGHEDVLRLPKINSLKEEIKEYQDFH